MEMDVEEASGGVPFVILRGRLDTVGAGAIDFKFNAIAAARRAVVVDSSQVDFPASLGIRVLVLEARAVKNKAASS
jgi:anti-anti-sigma regulatory factor